MAILELERGFERVLAKDVRDLVGAGRVGLQAGRVDGEVAGGDLGVEDLFEANRMFIEECGLGLRS